MFKSDCIAEGVKDLKHTFGPPIFQSIFQLPSYFYNCSVALKFLKLFQFCCPVKKSVKLRRKAPQHL